MRRCDCLNFRSAKFMRRTYSSEKRAYNYYHRHTTVRDHSLLLSTIVNCLLWAADSWKLRKWPLVRIP